MGGFFAVELRAFPSTSSPLIVPSGHDAWQLRSGMPPICAALSCAGLIVTAARRSSRETPASRMPFMKSRPLFNRLPSGRRSKPPRKRSTRRHLYGDQQQVVHSVAFRSGFGDRHDGHFGPSLLWLPVAERESNPPQPKAADLQPTRRSTPTAREFPNNSAQEVFSTRPSQLPKMFSAGRLTQLGLVPVRRPGPSASFDALTWSCLRLDDQWFARRSANSPARGG